MSSRLNFQPIKMKDDGNCFYRFIAQGILKDEERYLGIKNKVSDYIKNNLKDFEQIYTL